MLQNIIFSDKETNTNCHKTEGYTFFYTPSVLIFWRYSFLAGISKKVKEVVVQPFRSRAIDDHIRNSQDLRINVIVHTVGAQSIARRHSTYVIIPKRPKFRKKFLERLKKEEFERRFFKKKQCIFAFKIVK